MSDNKRMKFQGHEKFALREGWLNKGMEAVAKDPRVFKDKYATDALGVGTNMVKAIRYWMTAFRLIKEERKEGTLLTDLGKVIYKEDVYFDKYFTLWVLHSNLVNNSEDATTWYAFFEKADFEEAEKEELDNFIIRELLKYSDKDTLPEKSIKTDIDVLLKMYSNNTIKEDPEEKNVCPLSKLGLVSYNGNTIAKKSPDLQIIDEWAILYELARIFEIENSDIISIDRVSDGEDSISNVFNLSRIVVNQYLDKIENMGYIKVDRTAGLDMIYKEKDFDRMQIVKEYYKGH